MVQDIQGQVVCKIAPQVADHIKSVIEKALYEYDLGDQSVDGFSVNVSSLKTSVPIEVNPVSHPPSNKYET